LLYRFGRKKESVLLFSAMWASHLPSFQSARLLSGLAGEVVGRASALAAKSAEKMIVLEDMVWNGFRVSGTKLEFS
jgi:hypothetical protein